MLDLELSLLDVRGDSVIPAAAYLAETEDKTRVAMVRKSSGMARLICICLIAMSRDFFESDLPKPELSWEDFLELS